LNRFLGTPHMPSAETAGLAALLVAACRLASSSIVGEAPRTEARATRFRRLDHVLWTHLHLYQWRWLAVLHSHSPLYQLSGAIDLIGSSETAGSPAVPRRSVVSDARPVTDCLPSAPAQYSPARVCTSPRSRWRRGAESLG